MKSRNNPTILIADPNPIFLKGLEVFITTQTTSKVIGKTIYVAELLHLTGLLQPDIIITDIAFPNMDGIEIIPMIKQKSPSTSIITLIDSKYEMQALEIIKAGTESCISKDDSEKEIAEAIFTVTNNKKFYSKLIYSKFMMFKANPFSFIENDIRKHFTALEIEIIQLICQEYNSKQIAYRLKRSMRTIESYRQKVQNKIGANNVAGMVLFAVKNGIFDIQSASFHTNKTSNTLVS